MKPWYLRAFLWLFSVVCYRVEVVGADHLPTQGGALMVSNHISLVDVLLILASTPRFVRFLLPEEVCARWWLRPALRCLRVIPLPHEKYPHKLAAALRQAGETIRQGEVVGIFAERSISRIGVMLPFRHETGDIASSDEDGFLQIADRLSRFSKIGGEMVPHVTIEEKLHELAGVQELTFVVAGVPDPKKGERLVVLHTLDEAAVSELLKHLSQLELPKLWTPKAAQFFAVDELPYLASGKLDLRKIRETAAQFSQSCEPEPREVACT